MQLIARQTAKKLAKQFDCDIEQVEEFDKGFVVHLMDNRLKKERDFSYTWDGKLLNDTGWAEPGHG